MYKGRQTVFSKNQKYSVHGNSEITVWRRGSKGVYFRNSRHPGLQKCCLWFHSISSCLQREEM